MQPEDASLRLESDADSTDLALRRFDALLRYLGTETAAFWSRSQLFMVANAALLGLIVGSVAKERDVLIQTKVVLIIGDSCGIVLCALWIQALHSSSEKVKRWIQLLEQLEPEAFGDLHLFRSFSHGRSRRIASRAAWLFVVLWSLFTFYVVWLPVR